MAKIKIKDIEGDADALVAIFSNSDCSLADYLNANKGPKIKVGILVTTASAFFIFATILFCLPAEYIILSKVLTMFTFALAGTTILFAHLYWKNVLATIIVTVVAICLYLVSIGSMSPAEAGNKVNERIEKIGS